MEEGIENSVPFDLISKVIEGEASQEEVAQLDEWRKESEQNEKEYQNLAQIMGEVPNSVPEVDVNFAWEKVESRIEEPEESKNKRKNPLYYLVAACVAVLVGLFLLPIESGPNKVSYVAKADGEVYWLPDSSKLTLKKGAKIDYNSDFGKEVRNIVFDGEAFFNIKRDTTKTFNIHLSSHSVTILGTSFNIQKNSDSIEVVVASGKVSFAKIGSPTEKVEKHILIKGDVINYNTKSNTVRRPSYVNPATLFYATKTLVFKRTKMNEVVQVLSSVYKHEVEIGCDAVGSELYNGRFEDLPLNEVLEIISATMETTLEIKDGKTLITKDVCN